jgi:hypothetical protein
VLVGDAKEAYLELRQKVADETSEGSNASFHRTLLNSIDRKIAMLKMNYDSGVHIPKKNVAQKYIAQYDVTNLWKVNLAGGWRMVYTIKQLQKDGTEIEILSIWLDVLDIISHEEYDKIFSYRKR